MNRWLPVVLLLAPAAATAAGPSGHYAGAVTREGSVQLLSFDFSESNGALRATYDIPEVGYADVPVERVAWNRDTLALDFFYGSILCRVDSSSGDITGISQQWNPKVRLHLKPSARPPRKLIEREVSFRNGAVSLSGLVLSPLASGAIPYVVLIHGSDAQHRNTPYYRSLGTMLARNGIGALLYDKRGCGRSTGSWENATFDELAGDAVAAMRCLESQKGLAIARVGFLGTSQGGWLAPMAARRARECAFVVLNAGSAVSVAHQDLDRVRYSMAEDQLDPAIRDSAVAYTQLYFEHVRKNSDSTWAELERQARVVKDRPWASYVNLPSGRNDPDLRWWRSHAYDPAATLRATKCPVLALFGEKDVLVPPAENQARMESLLAAARVRHRIVVIPGTGHSMVTYQGLNGDDWDWPRVYWRWRRQPPEFLQTIVEFIRER